MTDSRTQHPAGRTERERWFLRHDGHEHVVTITDLGFRREAVWTLDGEEVDRVRTEDERVVLCGGERGAVGLRLPTFVGPARRVTWHPDDEVVELRARAGAGGVDFRPEAGSAGARREEYIRAHPNRYAARRAAVAVLAVAAPLLLSWLVAMIQLPHLALPGWDLPTIPWPDVDWPTIPWPVIDWPVIDWPVIDWPTIPWPDVDWPDLPVIAWPTVPELPAWVRTVLRWAAFVWPVLIAVAVARAEVRRRRHADAREATTGQRTPDPREAPAAPASPASAALPTRMAQATRPVAPAQPTNPGPREQGRSRT